MLGTALLGLWLPCRGLALDPAKDVHQYACQSWNRQIGLPVNGVNAITQTKDGYIWLGTHKGLVRFDGVEFTLVGMAQGKQLRSTIVRCLAPSRNGGLWFGLEESGYGYYEARSGWLPGNDDKGAADGDTHVLVETDDGKLLVGNTGLSIWLAKDGAAELVFGDLPEDARYNLTAAGRGSAGRVWLGTANKGLFFWENGKLSKVPDPSLDSELIFAVAEDLSGELWLGTQHGLRCFDSRLRRKEVGFPTTEIRALLVDRHGVLWIGTTGSGLMRWQDGDFASLRKNDGLADDYVQALAEDREGSLWIGNRNGLSHLTDVKFPVLSKPQGAAMSVQSVSASRRGGLWMATDKGAAYIDEQSRIHPAETASQNPYVKRALEASNGDLFLLSGRNEIEILSNGKLVARHPTTGMAVAMAEDARGVVVSVGGELYRVGRDSLTPYPFANDQKPPLHWILNLAIARDGALWVASVNGVCRIKDAQFQQWTTQDGLSGNQVRWVCEDDEGVIWVGMGTGLARLKGNQVRNIRQEDGLLDANIYATVPDHRGDLWVDSTRGLYRVGLKSLNDFADREIGRVECVAHDSPEAVKSADKTNQEQSGCRTRDGRIWFPRTTGVVRIDPANIPTNPVAPPVYIHKVRANGTDAPLTNSLVVPPGKGDLEFHYTALSFITPKALRFRYQLEGYDSDWVEAENRRVAFYTNLKPGQYKFRVIACNADGIWNATGDSFDLRLFPHFRQTVWFRVLCGLLTFCVLAGIYASRMRHLQQKQLVMQQTQEILEARVRERTSDLADANTSLKKEIEERKQAESQLHIQYAISRALAESSTLKEASARVLQTVCENLNWDVGEFWNVDRQSGVMRFDAMWSAPNVHADEFITLSREITFARGVGLPGRAWESGQPVWISDLAADANSPRGAAAKKVGLHGAFSSPILAGNEVVGVIEFFSREIRQPDEERLRMFAVLGSQLGQFFERKRLEEQLIQAQKMETVGKLSGGIAHEFNSIMTAIIGHSELLLGCLPSASPPTRNAQQIRKAADRAAMLTRQLLAYGRKQILQPEVLHLNKILADMETMLPHLMGCNVDVRIVPAIGLKPIKADTGQIEQVIMNIVLNARDAMPNGGKLTIETSNVTLGEEGFGRHVELSPGGHVMLAITDTGTGMSEEVKNRAFEPFFTTKGVGEGTGLGLATCYGIVKQSGGHITVYSEPGKGTTFKVYLPVIEHPKEASSQPRAPSDLPRGTETILLVEDDPTLREMACMLLRRLGYSVLGAANGINALSLVEQRGKDPIDLLFTDAVMPQMDGKELSDRVRALHPETKTLFTSAYTENAIVHQGVLDPGAALLQKPFTPSALAHKVREVLGTILPPR